MKIVVTSVMVHDQAHALEFYTGKLGFQIKHDIPMGEHRWLTLVSPEVPKGVELLLEPNAFPAAKTFQEALFAAGIPAASFGVDDLNVEYDRLIGLGVVFKGPPMVMGPVRLATLEDTCGNLIQLVQR